MGNVGSPHTPPGERSAPPWAQPGEHPPAHPHASPGDLAAAKTLFISTGELGPNGNLLLHQREEVREREEGKKEGSGGKAPWPR